MVEAKKGKRRIDYFFSVLSDWAYLGGERFEALAERYNAEVNHMPMDLASLYSQTGGILLNKRSKQRQDYRVVELVRWSRTLGIPVNLFPKHYPTSDALACCTIIAAKSQGSGKQVGELANAILRAIWLEERDISRSDVLMAAATRSGFDGKELVAQAQTDAMTLQLVKYTDIAQKTGVFGSPFYVLDGELFWGQDRLDFLEEKLKSSAQND